MNLDFNDMFREAVKEVYEEALEEGWDTESVRTDEKLN